MTSAYDIYLKTNAFEPNEIHFTQDDLLSHGLVFVKELSCGANGCAIIVNKDDKEYVLKIGLKTDMAIFASDNKIGPHVYDEFELDGYHAILMDKMQHSLEEMLPLSKSQERKLYKLATKCYNLHFDHADLLIPNVMYNKGNFYLIDFDFSKIVKDRAPIIHSWHKLLYEPILYPSKHVILDEKNEYVVRSPFLKMIKLEN